MSSSVKVVPHPSVPGAYFCRFTHDGRAPEWIFDNKGTRRVFTDPVLAEVNGYRELIGRINGDATSTRRSPSQRKSLGDTSHASEARKVFENFKDGVKKP